MHKGMYVDGFVIPIPKKNRAKYIKMAKEGKAVWTKFGALDYKECLINDAKPQNVKTTFAKMARAKDDEEVWFSYITFKSKAHRDAVNKKVMAYFNKKYGEEAGAIEMPFDMNRFATAGFKVMVSA